MGGRARLIELKVASNNPLYALRQLLEYGAVYAFCRVHKRKLPLHCRLHLGMMKAPHISLEVVAPHYFHKRHGEEAARVARMQEHLDEFCRSRMDGVSMSMSALVFPDDLPKIETREDIEALFDGDDLTDAGKRVCEAFRGLIPVWPEP